jgi:hypothetical protein
MPPRTPPPELSTTWARVLGRRVRRQHLDTTTDEGIVAVARRLNGVHAQVMSSAEVAIGLRAGGIMPEDVRRALVEERSLVKTWAARGTLHLLPADDLPLWVGALSVRTRQFSPAWLRYHHLTEDDLLAVLDTMPRALDGRVLTREEVSAEIARLTRRPHLRRALAESWGGIFKPAAYRGLVCFGPNRGRNVTFVAPRQWVGHWEDVDPDTALAEILRRYLDVYGPATRDEFARWLALDPRPARALFERQAPELVEVDVEGRPAWTTPGAAAELAGGEDQAEVVRLLPAFDPYVIGSLRHLDPLLPDGRFRKRVSRAAGWISPVLLVDGRFVATWQQEVRGGRARIRLEPFGRITKRVRVGAESSAVALGRLLGAGIEVEWAEPEEAS